MSVLYLSNTPILGGTSRILQSWLQLAQRDGRRGIVVLRPGSHFIDWGLSRGFNVFVDPMPVPDLRAPWSACWHLARVARWARRAGITLVHCNEHDIYPFASLLKRWLRVPVVCHVRYRIGRKYAEWVFGGRRVPDALLWTSHQQRTDSADAVAGLIPEAQQHTIPLGVDLSQFGRDRDAGRHLREEWGVEPGQVLVGIPSPLRPRKRIHEFVELVRRLNNRQLNVVGIIAGAQVPGDENYRAGIERQIVDTGLGNRLRWVGFLDPIEPFHHACDISVSTSEYETFGNSVCEAMACGKPVAAYRGGSVAEVVGDAGIVVETGDLDGLTEAVVHLAIDESLRRALGQRGRERVASEYNPERSWLRLTEIYNSLLLQNGGQN